MDNEAPSPQATSAVPVAARPFPWAVVATVMAVLALGGTAVVWRQLDQARQELARQSTDTQVKVVASELHANEAKAQVQELAARLSVAEVRLSEVSLQRSQLEELMLSLSRSRDDSLVQDLESAIRLAQQHTQLTGSVQPLVSALQAAEQRIAKAAQPRLNPVQRAIGRDVARIQAAKVLDVPALVTRLDEVLRQADQWALANSVPPVPRTPKPQPPAVQATPPVAPPPPVVTDSAWGRFKTTVAGMWTTWGGAWWAGVQTQVADLVRVNRIDRPEAALLAPKEAYFARENLKLRLLHARMALLARQTDTAKADVLAVRQLMARYFDPAQVAVQTGAETLLQLHRDMGQPDMPRADDTLAALVTAAGGR
ncbi:MAG: hypothetical protein RJA09_2521 [Pseudomonadota bacterium]